MDMPFSIRVLQEKCVIKMTKSNFLLVDLNEPKVKKLAETITSETSRKILNHLTEKEDTEQNISKALGMPISTVHYHLQRLQEAQLVKVDEFHYSPKGREVNHYKLANKYIIIAPQKVAGLREKLKGVLPVGLIIVGISVIIKLIQSTPKVESVRYAAESMASETPLMIDGPGPTILIQSGILQSSLTWFLIGGLGALGLYVLWIVLKEKLSKK